MRKRYSNGDRRKACEGKKPHRTLAEAQRALRGSMTLYGDLTLIYYNCEFCGNFHIGHPPERALKKQLRYERMLKLIDYANSH